MAGAPRTAEGGGVTTHCKPRTGAGAGIARATSCQDVGWNAETNLSRGVPGAEAGNSPLAGARGRFSAGAGARPVPGGVAKERRRD